MANKLLNTEYEPNLSDLYGAIEGHIHPYIYIYTAFQNHFLVFRGDESV
jgi:hypothetical protein